MNRRLLAMALLLAAAGCGQGELTLDLAPRFAALLEVPGLLGVVIVTRADGGEEVARAGLVAFEGSAATRLGGIPAGVDLLVRVEWYAGAGMVLVAESAAQPVRLAEGKTSSVAFDADALDYPDTDGDGAANLAEVVWEDREPGAAASAWNDPTRVPPGFLTGFVAAIPTPGMCYSVAPFGTMSVVAVTQSDLTRQGGNLVPTNQRIEVLEPTTRNHLEHPLTCSASGYPLTARVSPVANPPEVAVLCGATLSFVQPEPNLGLSSSGVATLQFESPRIAYSRDGSLVYVPHKEAGSISVVGATPFQPDHAQLLRVLAAPALPADGVFMDAADTGAHLLVSDAGGGGLLVLSRPAGQVESLVGRILADSLDTPGLLLVHPAGGIAYVATSDVQAGRYALVAIDIRGADPTSWSIAGEVPLDGPAVGLATDARLGAYLYVATMQTVYGVDAFSFGTLWTRTSGQLDLGLFLDLSIAGDGSAGFVPQSDTRGVFVLGVPSSADLAETEPNGRLPAEPQPANVLRVDGGPSVGFVTLSDPEVGPLTEIACRVHE
ncbi:MAG TPA: hypothetical protein P5076_09075 [Myxococcota bacterium]|nr:hypothetical protein [Myxococcota bacterium]